MRRVLVFGFALAPVVAPFAGCGGDGSGAAPDGSEDARADGPGRDVATYDGEPVDAAVDHAPTYNTDGWIEIPFDPDVSCGFYAAPTPEKMPAPITWEPCDPTMTASGWNCRKIAFNWAPPNKGLFGDLFMASALAGWRDDADHVWLIVNRFSGGNAYYLVAEDDGPIHAAVARPSGQCYITGGSLFGGHFVLAAHRSDSGNTIYRMGAIGGDVDKVPLVLESSGDGIARGYAAGPNAYFAIPQYALRSWASPSSVIAQVPTPSPGTAEYFTFVGDMLFFPFGNLSYHRIEMYSPDGGTQEFVSYGNDVSKGASDFGTDGQDMVWTEAFGRTAPGQPWDTINIMTAPYTTDPSAIQKRRLRSESNSIGVAPFVVGCGYAAHFYSSTTEGSGTRLVRLSDGRSWRFHQIDVDGGGAWQFGAPFAVTCDELFVGFGRGYQANVARIRLDSLGAGDPPD